MKLLELHFISKSKYRPLLALDRRNDWNAYTTNEVVALGKLQCQAQVIPNGRNLLYSLWNWSLEIVIRVFL